MTETADQTPAFDPKKASQKELARRELSRRRLLPFTQTFVPKYQAGWFHKDLALRLEKFSDDVIAEREPRLMLFVPPRMGKSEISSRRFPAWHLGRAPDHEFIGCSYSGSLAMGFSRAVRSTLRDPMYQNLFDTRLDPDSQSVESWLTSEGGGYLAAGVGGAVTGNGAHIMIIDDPVKNREDAESASARQATYDWYTSTAYTRLAPGGGVILIMCMTGDTDVLTADGTERKLRDIRPGDEIATYDEGRLATTRVLNWTNNGPDSVFRITMASGGSVKANVRHPFLACRGGPAEWVALKDLRPGDRIVRTCDTSDFTLDPIESIEYDGVEDVFDVQVERTENFIANGVVSHNTRWHDDDLAGRLLDDMKSGADQWEIVNYPAIAEEDEPFRNKGDALHSTRYPTRRLHAIRATIGPRDWNALYQQKPIADEGDYFNKGMFRYYEPKDLPDRNEMKFYGAWDLAIGQKQSNDWSVGGCVGVDRNDRMWLVDLFRGRVDSMDLVNEILNMQARWGQEIVGIERGQIQMALGPFLNQQIQKRRQFDFILEDMMPGRQDKVSRSRTIQGLMQQGMFMIPDPQYTPWVADLVNELLRFPYGTFDDQVDMLAWLGLLVNKFSSVGRPSTPDVPRSWKDRLARMTGSTSGGSSMAA